MSRSAFKRMLRRHGETWTINSFAGSDRDEYEDEIPGAALTSTIRGIRVQPVGGATEERDEKGRVLWTNLDLLIRDDTALPTGTDPEITIILTSPEGRQFQLVDINKMAVPVGAKRMKLQTGGADAAIYP